MFPVDPVERQLSRCRELIAFGDTVLASHNAGPPNYIGSGWVNAELFGQWRSRSIALLRDTLGDAHTYTQEFTVAAKSEHGKTPTKLGKGVLSALLADLEAGYLQGFRRLIVAEVFSDLIAMAEHLHEQGYHAAAASLAGGVLEDSLRHVASASGIPVKSRDDLTSLNGRIAEKGIYDRLTQKEISVWIDIRNAADHGEWEKVTSERVGEFLRGLPRLLQGFADIG